MYSIYASGWMAESGSYCKSSTFTYNLDHYGNRNFTYSAAMSDAVASATMLTFIMLPSRYRHTSNAIIHYYSIIYSSDMTTHLTRKPPIQSKDILCDIGLSPVNPLRCSILTILTYRDVVRMRVRHEVGLGLTTACNTWLWSAARESWSSWKRVCRWISQEIYGCFRLPVILFCYLHVPSTVFCWTHCVHGPLHA